MTDTPSEAAKRKACELANAHCIPTRHRSDDVHVGYSSLYALALRLDFEDLLARRVDGFLKLRGDTPTSHARDALRSLMLPDPPDPDEELAREMAEQFATIYPHAAEEISLATIKRLREQGRLTDAK